MVNFGAARRRVRIEKLFAIMTHIAVNFHNFY